MFAAPSGLIPLILTQGVSRACYIKNKGKNFLITKHKPCENLFYMRNFLIFLTLFSFLPKAWSQEKGITINIQNGSVYDIVSAIEKQSSYMFFYKSEDIDKNVKVSITANNQPIKAVLDDLASKTDLAYTIKNMHIVLGKKNSTAFTPITVTGVIKDDVGIPLPGVGIQIKGDNSGAYTNSNGEYSISVPGENAVLQVSFMGFETQEVTVGKRAVIDVVLKDDLTQLEDVIVIGYGTAKRKDLTGSIARIGNAEMQNKPANNVMDFLRGTVAGFNSNMTTSAKGGGSLEVRGPTSITASNTPLLVVDGIIYNGDIADINPADIETMDILKDGSAAAVYGTRAASGVLVITTKRGRGEKPTITFSASLGISSVAKRQEIYSPEEYIIVKGDAKRSMNGFTKPEYYYRDPNKLPAGVTLNQWLDGVTGDPASIWKSRIDLADVEYENYLNNKTTDWYDEVFQTGLRQDYNVGVGGTTKRTNYYFSLGYLNNEGIVKGDQYQNIRSRLNLSINVTDWLEAGLHAQFADRDQSTNPASWGSAITASPYGNKYNDDGTLKWFPHEDNLASNPFNNFAADLLNKNTNIIGNVFAKVKLPWDIKYEINFNNRYAFGKVYNFYSTDTYTGRLTTTSTGEQLGGVASRQESSHYSWQVDNIVTWGRTIADIHRFDVTLLFNAEKTQTWSSTINASQFSPSDLLGYHNMSAGLASNLRVSGEDTYATGTALMARVNYSLLDKYLLTLSIRRDGYSAFGQSNPYGNFPAAAFAWRISDESFMQGTKGWLDNLKLRLSWGINGNRDISPYAALARVANNKTVIDGVAVTQIYSNTLANKELKWEKTMAYNAAFDFSLFKNRLHGSIEGYFTKTTDLLLTRALPPVIGYQSVIANLGEIQNKGFEMTLNSLNMKTRNFQWSSTFIFSFNRNKVVHLYGNMTDIKDENGNIIGQKEADDDTNGWYIDHALDEIYNYEIGGVWQESEKDEAQKYGRVPGDFRLVDHKNTSSKVAVTDEDRVFLGFSKPRYRLGLKNNFNLFNCLDISFFLRADLGHKGSISYYKHRQNGNYYDRLNAYKYDYWTPENPINNAARLHSGQNPDHGVYKLKSFMRLQDFTISYTFPKKLVSKARIENLRVYMNINNAFTVTGWDYWDPETSAPTPRIFSFGLNLTL